MKEQRFKRGAAVMEEARGKVVGFGEREESGERKSGARAEVVGAVGGGEFAV